tara:strand:+ start:648 stop:1328 length:681 start_codon:yes stop_codon:yes gene_type:complete
MAEQPATAADVLGLPPKDAAPWDTTYSQPPQQTITPVVSDPITEDIKNPFTDTQNKAAMFAYRQLKAIEETDALLAGGYNPGTDYYNYIASFLPDIVEGIFTSTQYKLWQRAVTDLSTAQLRPETGAVINDGEIVWIEETMWDKIGEFDPAVGKAKREARLRAHIGNKAVAGKAYDRLVVAMEAGDSAETNKKVYAAMQRIAGERELSEYEQDYMNRLKSRIDEAN